MMRARGRVGERDPEAVHRTIEAVVRSVTASSRERDAFEALATREIKQLQWTGRRHRTMRTFV